MFVRPDSTTFQQSGYANTNVGTKPTAPLRGMQQQSNKKAAMMRRLADVTNKLMNPGRNCNTIQKEPSLRRTGTVLNHNNPNFPQFAIPQMLNRSQQHAGLHDDNSYQYQGSNYNQLQNYQGHQQQFHEHQQQFHQQGHHQLAHRNQPQDDMQYGSEVPTGEMRIQQPPRHVHQPVIRVQLTFSDIPARRERRPKRTGKKRPVVNAYSGTIFSPVQEDIINELPTPQREAALKSLSRPVPPRRDPVDPSFLHFDEVLVETDTARPGERVVVADAFMRRPFFSKYAGRTGTLLRKSASPGGGGWMVEFGDLGVQFFSTGSINGVHHLAYAKSHQLVNASEEASSRNSDIISDIVITETSAPPPQISISSLSQQHSIESSDVPNTPRLLPPQVINEMVLVGAQAPPLRPTGPMQMVQHASEQHMAYAQQVHHAPPVPTRPQQSMREQPQREGSQQSASLTQQQREAHQQLLQQFAFI